MTAQVEELMRQILEADGSITQEEINRAIRIMKGAPIDHGDLVHVIRYQKAAKLLGVHRCTIDYFVRMGYLDRVMGGGKSCIGITSESYQRFIRRWVDHREPPAVADRKGGRS